MQGIAQPYLGVYRWLLVHARGRTTTVVLPNDRHSRVRNNMRIVPPFHKDRIIDPQMVSLASRIRAAVFQRFSRSPRSIDRLA